MYRETPSTGASPPSGKKRPRKAGAVSVELIAGKVQAGRYRSSVAFESDARQMITQGKGPRSLIPEQVRIYTWRFFRFFSSRLVLSRLGVFVHMGSRCAVET